MKILKSSASRIQRSQFDRIRCEPRVGHVDTIDGSCRCFCFGRGVGHCRLASWRLDQNSQRGVFVNRTLKFLLAGLGLLVLGVGVVWWQADWLIAKVYLAELESEGRIRGLQIERVLDQLEVGPGKFVADIGAGTGVFTRPFSRAVGDSGRVFAVDVNQELLRHLRDEASRLGLSNVEVISGGPTDPLSPQTVDLVFICDTLHHIADRQVYLKNLRNYLREGGRLAVIDFREGRSPHLMASAKYAQAELDPWSQAAGFRKLATYDFLGGNFLSVFGVD